MIFSIYDLEIIKGIPVGDLIEGIEYCQGWNDYSNMGISVGALCFLDTDNEEISEPIALTSVNQLGWTLSSQRFPIGGFNSKKFDDRLLQANGIDVTSDFDILELVLKASNNFGTAYWTKGLKYNLAAIAEANGYHKTLTGELAPIEWQRGNEKLVIDYCKNDVLIEAETLKRLLNGTLIDPNDGKFLKYSERDLI